MPSACTVSSAGGMPRATALSLAAEVARRLVFEGGRARRVRIVGSLRRGARRAKDLDFLIEAASPRALGAASLRPPRRGERAVLEGTAAAGARHRVLLLRAGGIRCRADLFVATPRETPYAMYHYTGPREYNVRTRAHAKRRGLRLNQYGLYMAASGRRAPGAAAVRTERQLARLLGVTYRPPSER